MPPLYGFECGTCGKVSDEFRRIADRNEPLACECGAVMTRVIGGHHVVGDFEPYYDDNLQAHIRSKQHRKQVMREQGVDEKFGTHWYTAKSSKKRARA